MRLFRLCLVALVFAASCSKQDNSTSKTVQASTAAGMFTKVIYSRDDVSRICLPLGAVGTLFQANTYAQVRASELPAFTQRYRYFLFGPLNVPISEVSYKTGWTPRFNCVFFSESYAVLAGSELNSVSFYSWTAADRPAVFVVWYFPTNAPVDSSGRRIPHSIVLVLTDVGPKFIEPQMSWTPTGEVNLTQTEINSIYHRRG